MSEREQLPPDALSTQAENELICEKLLGWSKAQWFGGWAGNWDRPDGGMCAGTPSFTSWAEAGLILEAFRENDLLVSIQFTGKGGFCAVNDVSADQRSGSMPLTIRAAALKYIKAVKS